MKPIFTRQATEADLRYIAERLTEDDRAEVIAYTGLDPVQALLPLAGASTFVGGLADQPDNPMIVFGTSPVEGVVGVGYVWLLTTPDVFEHPVELVKNLKDTWDRIHKDYPVLMNWADSRNERHLRLLRWLGCTLFEPRPLGPYNIPFIEFASIRPCA